MEDKSFFYPNCCHICKRWDVELYICGMCRMICYCTEEHQRQHWPQHHEICAAIKHVLENKKYMNTKQISRKEWIKIRNNYLNRVSVKLKRVLKNEEMQMFYFPTACIVCHRQDTLIRCKGCPSAAFCDKHTELKHREKHCKLLKECCEVTQYLNLTRYIDISYLNRLSSKMFFYNMKSFLHIYLPLDKDNVYLQMLHSNLVTYPLTVYFCIRQLYHLRCETLNIHALGAYVTCEVNQIEVWKMLLILIPTLTTLTITFVQNKEPFICDTYTVVVWENKKLETNMRYMSYKEYMDSTDFKKPDFIVGFNARIRDDRFATDNCVDISALVGQMCPCILIFEYLYRREETMLIKIKKYFFGENPFRSLMVHRNCSTEKTYYAYNYLIIFNDLDSSKVFIKGNQCLLLPKTTRE